MRHIHRNIILVLLIVGLGTEILFAGKPKFSDQQISAMTPSYFSRSREAPKLVASNIYQHPQLGKVYRVEVRTDRNHENEALGFAFSAMLNLSQYFKKPPKQFVVVLHSNIRGVSPVICRGDVNCTKNHFIRKIITYDEWYNKCISFEGS